MAELVARTRLPGNKGLERYVKRNGRYYNYQHPEMRRLGIKAESFKTDRAAANKFAREANAHFDGTADRLGRMLADASHSSRLTLGEVIDKFLAGYHLLSKFKTEQEELDYVKRRGKKDFKTWSFGYTQSVITQASKIKRVEGKRPFASLRVPEWESILYCNFTNNGVLLARIVARHLYFFAIGKGLTTDMTNYPDHVITERQEKRQRPRIHDYAEFQELHAKCPDWLQDAMEISLLSPLGRSEVVRLEREDIRWEGSGKDKRMIIGGDFFRRKTGVPLEVEACPDLERAVMRCLARAMRLGCPYLICTTQQDNARTRQARRHRNQVLPDKLSREFLKHTGQRFHEIRSLSGRMLREMGWTKEQIKEYYRHGRLETTEIYLEEDRPKPVRVAPNFDLSRWKIGTK